MFLIHLRLAHQNYVLYELLGVQKHSMSLSSLFFFLETRNGFALLLF